MSATIVRSTVAASWPLKLFADDLAPMHMMHDLNKERMHMMHDLNNENDIRTASQPSHRGVGP